MGNFRLFGMYYAVCKIDCYTVFYCFLLLYFILNLYLLLLL